MRAKRWIFILIIALAAAGWYEWRGFSSGGPSTPDQSAGASAPKQEPKVPVTVATAQKSDFPVNLEGLGTVQAYNTVVIQSRVDGQIDKIFVKEGQIVKPGDLLLRVDPRPYQAALDQATAKKDQDQANLANAKLDLQRYSTLAQQNFASRQQLDTQQSTVRQLTAQIEGDQATIESAQVQLGYTLIRAPISGRIGFFTVDIGNIVHASSTTGIMTITQIQPIAVVFTAPEDELPKIYKAMQAGDVSTTALTTDDSDVLATGKLTVINNQVEATTGTIQLKAEFANKNGVLWPGLAVDTRLLTGTLKNVVVVPEDAVQHSQSSLYAYVVGPDDKAQMRVITVGDSGSGKIVITKGVNAGERVVVAGQYGLEQGSPLAISTQPENATLAQEQPQ